MNTKSKKIVTKHTYQPVHGNIQNYYGTTSIIDNFKADMVPETLMAECPAISPVL